jgi:hypothetical protein
MWLLWLQSSSGGLTPGGVVTVFSGYYSDCDTQPWRLYCCGSVDVGLGLPMRPDASSFLTCRSL